MTQMNTLTLNGQTYTLADTWARERVKELQLAAGAPIIFGQVSGETVTMTDASDFGLAGLTLYGKTGQLTTTGKNLFDKNTAVDGYGLGAAGSTYSAADKLTSAFIPVEAGETYTFSEVSWYNYYDADKTVISQASAPTFTVPDGAAYIRFTAPLADKDTTQLERGSVATEYEPYTGGAPSPSPEYPQDLISCGDGGSISVAVMGRNLCDAARIVNGAYNTSVSVSDDGYTIVSVGGSKAWANADIEVDITGLAGKTVYVKADSISYTQAYASGVLPIAYTQTGTVYLGSVQASWLKREITIPENTTRFILRVCTNNTGTTHDTDNTLTVKGLMLSVADHGDWEPYKVGQTLTVSTPNGLPGIPVSSGGNYTDENGQQWICDEVDFARGVYVQRVIKKTLKGTENWDNQQIATGVYRLRCYLTDCDLTITNAVLCDKLPVSSSTWNQIEGIGCSSGTLFVYLKDYNTVASLADWKAYLSQNPMMCLLPLATPIETALTAEELAAYAALHTNKPNTTVTNDGGCRMAVRYVADTKTYIDNKFAELYAALVNNV